MFYKYFVFIFIIVFLCIPLIMFLIVRHSDKKHIIKIKNTIIPIKVKYLYKIYYDVFRPNKDDGKWTVYYYLFEDENKKIYAIKLIDVYNSNKNDIANLWIEDKLNNFYIKEKDDIIIDNYKVSIIKSDDSSFDVSILDKVIFVKGYVEFDKK